MPVLEEAVMPLLQFRNRQPPLLVFSAGKALVFLVEPALGLRGSRPERTWPFAMSGLPFSRVDAPGIVIELDRDSLQRVAPLRGSRP
jgi:hypothetical protein